MALQGHYQNAYVTHDLDRAMALTGPLFGLGPFSAFDVEMALKTPLGEKISRVRVATAWAGALQVELIQPMSGYIDPYLHALPADPDDAAPRLHHVAMRREAEGIGCIFVDTRAQFGHLIEFVTATDAGWEMLGWPKG